MKKLLFITSIALLITTYSTAQDTAHHRQGGGMQTMMQNHMYQHNYFMFEKGKLYQCGEGKRTEINQPMMFGSGLKVNPNGTYQYGNMKQMQLKEGECLDMHGHRYSNQDMMRQHFRNDSLKYQKNKTNQKNTGKKTRGKTY